MEFTTVANIPEYLKPINVLDPDADEQIRKAGELSRRMNGWDLVCEVHGLFAIAVATEHLEREKERHRNAEECWHHIERKRHEEN